MFDVIRSSATLLNPQFNTAFNQLLGDLLQVVLLGISGLAAFAIKAWLASMQSGWKKAIAERFVKYAEQKLEDNTEKQKWVAEQMAAHFPRMKQEEIEHRIEEAVVNLKAQVEAPTASASVAVVTPNAAPTQEVPKP